MRVNFLSIAVLFLLSLPTYAEKNPWQITTNLTGAWGKYQDSAVRDDHSHLGAYLRLDYSDQFNFGGGYQRENISYHVGGDLEQDKYFVFANKTFFSDLVGGTLDAGLSLYSISSDITSIDVSDDVQVIAPRLRYMPWRKNYLLEVEYAASDYDFEQELVEDFKVSQWAATVGVAFNHQRDWLQLKGYYIDPDSGQYNNESSAELLWKHWLDPKNLLKLDSFYVSALVGDRQFLVDTASHVIFNLADVEVGAYAMGINWQQTDKGAVSIGLRYGQYDNEVLNNNYDDLLVYTSWSHQW